MFDQKNECNQLSGSYGDTGATRKTGVLHQSKSQFIGVNKASKIETTIYCNTVVFCKKKKNQNWGKKSKNCCILVHYSGNVPEVLQLLMENLLKEF